MAERPVNGTDFAAMEEPGPGTFVPPWPGCRCECCQRLLARYGRVPAQTADEYAALRGVLEEAVQQASQGKGKERHAMLGERFEDQQIIRFNQWLGSNHGALFQAMKKTAESTRLKPGAARAELLGAIVFLAAAVLTLPAEEKSLPEPGPAVPFGCGR